MNQMFNPAFQETILSGWVIQLLNIFRLKIQLLEKRERRLKQFWLVNPFSLWLIKIKLNKWELKCVQWTRGQITKAVISKVGYAILKLSRGSKRQVKAMYSAVGIILMTIKKQILFLSVQISIRLKLMICSRTM